MLLLLLTVLVWLCPRPQGCDGRGSAPVPAVWEIGPPLACPYAPEEPGFRLFTPAHRAMTRHPGFQLG